MGQGKTMTLPEHLGHYFRVGVATFWICIAVWETFQNGYSSCRCRSGGQPR